MTNVVTIKHATGELWRTCRIFVNDVELKDIIDYRMHGRVDRAMGGMVQLISIAFMTREIPTGDTGWAFLSSLPRESIISWQVTSSREGSSSPWPTMTIEFYANVTVEHVEGEA